MAIFGGVVRRKLALGSQPGGVGVQLVPARYDLADRPGLIQTRNELLSALVALLPAVRYPVAEVVKRARRPDDSVVLPDTTVRGWLQGRSFPQTEDQLRAFLEACGVPHGHVTAWLNAWKRARSAPRGRVVAEYHPLDLNVHEWIEVVGADPNRTPTYVPRAHDEQIRTLLHHVTGPRMIIARGGSSTGKTRACYEAIRAELPRWSLLHPRTPTELLEILDDVLPERVVLWLNETQNYFPPGEQGDRVASALSKLLSETNAPVVVLGTLWPDRWTRLKSPSDAPGTLGSTVVRDLVNHPAVHDVLVVADFRAPTDEAALRSAAEHDSVLAAALEVAGPELRVCQTIAGGPQLVKMYQAFGHSDRATERTAHAILSAAMDAHRLGSTTPLPPGLLKRAVPGYLSPRFRAQASNWFDAGLAVLTQPVHGIQALEPRTSHEDTVTEPDTYKLHDYLQHHGISSRRREPVPATLWDAFLDPFPDRDIAAAVGRSAVNRDLDYYGRPLLTHAAAAGHRLASFDLVDLLEERGDVETLRDLADGGNADAAAVLSDLLLIPLAERGEIEVLRGLSATGNQDAADMLADVLAERNDVEGLHELAATGNGRASAAWR